MKLNHIGLNISAESEIDHFYTNILKFWPNRNFEITDELSREVFQHKGVARVFTVRNTDMVFELFLTNETQSTVFQHICLEVNNRDHVAEKAKAYGYPVIRIKKETCDLLFIKDNAGNTFELKNLQGEQQS